MRFAFVVSLTSIALAACGGGTEGTDTSTTATQITEYGLYARGTEIVSPDSSSPSGQSRSSVGFKLLATTTIVPLELGTSFGFCFETASASGIRPDVTVQATFPEFTRTDGTHVSSYQVKPSLYAYDGKYWTCLGYGFDHEYELVPGQWKFTVIVNGIPQATQLFMAQ